MSGAVFTVPLFISLRSKSRMGKIYKKTICRLIKEVHFDQVYFSAFLLTKSIKKCIIENVEGNGVSRPFFEVLSEFYVKIKFK